MAILQIQVPHATARLFGDIEVPGTRASSGSLHITVVYIGADVPIDTLTDAVKATYEVTSKTRPFTVRATRVTHFPVDDDQADYPIIARIDSDELHEFREQLVAAFDEAGVEFDKKFPVFKPHVTLSYAPEPVEEFRIPVIEWGAHEVVMWGGEEEDERLSVTFPFSLQPTMAHRVAARFTSVALARELSATRALPNRARSFAAR